MKYEKGGRKIDWDNMSDLERGKEMVRSTTWLSYSQAQVSETHMQYVVDGMARCCACLVDACEVPSQERITRDCGTQLAEVVRVHGIAMAQKMIRPVCLCYLSPTFGFSLRAQYAAIINADFELPLLALVKQLMSDALLQLINDSSN